MIPLIVAIVLLVLNGFFVAVEFGLVGARRTKIEPLAEAGSRRAKLALAAMGDLNTQLAGAQLGITMASLGIGFVAEPALADGLQGIFHDRIGMSEGVAHTVAFIIALTIVVFMHMVIGEMVPKNATLSDPDRTLLLLAVPNDVYLKVFRPIVWALNALSNQGMRMFGVEPRDEFTSAHTADELAVMLAESRGEGLIEEFSHNLMTGVLDFGGRDAASVMVPADELVTLPRTATVAEVERAVIDSGHSRIPITDHDIDTVLGFIHSKDLLTLPESAYGQPVPLGLVRRMLMVPRTRSLEDLLLSMRKSRVHLALVIEDNRTTAGLVTLEDLLEELVGEILDESDHREAIERARAELAASARRDDTASAGADGD